MSIMHNELLVYMDCCCLNRPTDDQTQDKIRIETDAIIGDYTKDRHNWLDGLTIENISNEIKKTKGVE
jgi:hypothetical protein